MNLEIIDYKLKFYLNYGLYLKILILFSFLNSQIFKNIAF